MPVDPADLPGPQEVAGGVQLEEEGVVPAPGSQVGHAPGLGSKSTVPSK